MLFPSERKNISYRQQYNLKSAAGNIAEKNKILEIVEDFI